MQEHEKLTKEGYEQRREEAGQKDNKAPKDIKALDPTNAWLFDDNEPEWMSKVGLHTRKCVYEQLTKTSYEDILGRGIDPILKAAAIIIGFGGIGILDIFTSGMAKTAFENGNKIPLILLGTTNLTVIYSVYRFCSNITESHREDKALRDSYRDKSMEYILREAHSKGLIKNLEIPDISSKV